MVELVWDESFLKNVKKWLKKHPELKIKFEERIRLFTLDPFSPSLKTHNLSGKLNKYWASVFRTNIGLFLNSCLLEKFY
jgi:mRNA-degrading endonuclease YafQ of YafQ-DinJ toxin-antitoxin module